METGYKVALGVIVLIIGGILVYYMLRKEAPPAGRTPPCGSYGDLDGDGRITENDALLLGRYLVGEISLTEEQLARADVKGDGTVNVGDLLFIGQYIAGTVDTFPVCSLSSGIGD